MSSLYAAVISSTISASVRWRLTCRSSIGRSSVVSEISRTLSAPSLSSGRRRIRSVCQRVSRVRDGLPLPFCGLKEARGSRGRKALGLLRRSNPVRSGRPEGPGVKVNLRPSRRRKVLRSSATRVVHLEQLARPVDPSAAAAYLATTQPRKPGREAPALRSGASAGLGTGPPVGCAGSGYTSAPQSRLNLLSVEVPHVRLPVTGHAAPREVVCNRAGATLRPFRRSLYDKLIASLAIEARVDPWLFRAGHRGLAISRDEPTMRP